LFSRMSLSECARRSRVSTFLTLLEEANYDLKALVQKIDEQKAVYRRLLEDAEKGIIHDQSIFRVEMPGFYADRYKKALSELDDVLERAQSLKDLANGTGDYEDYKPELRLHLLQWEKKREYKGFVARFNKAIEAFQNGKQAVLALQ